MEKQFLKKLLIWKMVFTMFFLSFGEIKKSYAIVPLLAVPVAEAIAAAVIANASRKAAITIAEKLWVSQKIGSLVAQANTGATITSGVNTLNGIAAILGLTFLLKSSTSEISINGSNTATVTSTFDPVISRPSTVPKQEIKVGTALWTLQSFSPVSVNNPGFADPYTALLYKRNKEPLPSSYMPDGFSNCQYFQSGAYSCDWHAFTPPSTIGSITAYPSGSVSTINCPGGGGSYGSQCIGVAIPEISTQVQPSTSVIAIADLATSPSLSPQARTQPLTPQTIAEIADKIAEKITQAPGTPFPTYDPAKPVTQVDVKTPTTTMPTIDTVTAPTSPSAQMPTSPLSTPISTIPGSPELPIEQPAPNQPETPPPNIGPPGLEAIPTIDKILSPILNLMPTLKNFAVPAHTTQCPVLDIHFTFKEKQFGGPTTAHCDLMAQHRDAIRTATIVFTTILVVFIFLGA